MIKSILALLPWLAKIIAERGENRLKASKRNYANFRTGYELRKEKRTDRARLLDSVDRLRDDKAELPKGD